MNIQDYADALNLEIRLTRYANQNNRWIAQFERCDTKDDAASCVLTSNYGSGVDPHSAIGDYVDEIRGKILVHCANSPEERRFVVPKTLTAK